MSTSSMRAAAHCTAAALLLAVVARAGEPGDQLSGRWRPEDDPAAVVNVVCRAGVCDGVLAAHAEHPERVGTHVLRALRWQADQQRWSGQVYAARLDRVLDADASAGDRERFTLAVHTWLGTRHVVWQRLPEGTPK